jgi:hypothetical protein
MSSAASSPRIFQELEAAALTPLPAAASPASSAASSPRLYQVLGAAALTPSPAAASPASTGELSPSAHEERVAEIEAGREWRARKLAAETPRRRTNIHSAFGSLSLGFRTPPVTPPHRRRTSSMTPPLNGRAGHQLHDSEKSRKRLHAEEYNTPEIWKRARLQ